MKTNKIPVAILGATGMVGQKFISLLSNHPWFEIKALAASSKSAGKTYSEAVKGRWKIEHPIPEKVKNIKIVNVNEKLPVKIAFSGLDSSIAGEVETFYAKSGITVISNSKNHRMEEFVPLVVPEINHEHIKIIKKQKTKGIIITNPNCSTIGLTMALAPIHKAFGLEKVIVTTMQAVSGAGYPGVPSMDILDNVIPNISGEEEKIETETLKILGTYFQERIHYADIKVSATTNRVPVINAHTECVSFSLREKASESEIIKVLKDFNPLKKYNLPLSPSTPIIYTEDEFRPQPRFDRDIEKSMAVTVGRLRKCSVLDYKMTVLSHNTVRGAAGCAILIAEFMHKNSLLD